MYFDEHIHAFFNGLLIEFKQLLRFKRFTDQQDRIRSDAVRFFNLNGINDKILAQHRQGNRAFHI